MMLIVSLVEGRDLPLTERIVKRVVNGCGRDAQPGSLVAIYDDVALQSARLLIARDVRKPPVLPQLIDQSSGPIVEFLQVWRLERVLEQSFARAATGANVLHRLEDRQQAFDRRELLSEAVDNLGYGGLAFSARFQGDEHAAIINGGASGSAADERTNGKDVWISQDDTRCALLELTHRGKGNVLGCLGAGNENPGVLLGEE